MFCGDLATFSITLPISVNTSEKVHYFNRIPLSFRSNPITTIFDSRHSRDLTTLTRYEYQAFQSHAWMSTVEYRSDLLISKAMAFYLKSWLKGYSVTFWKVLQEYQCCILASSDHAHGWPLVQLRVLHELIYSARRMGQPIIAVRWELMPFHCYNSTLSKMPERSRTSRVSQIVQSFCPKVPFFAMDWETNTNSLCGR